MKTKTELFDNDKFENRTNHWIDGKFCSKRDAEIAKKMKRNKFLELKVNQQNRIIERQRGMIVELLKFKNDV